jgi:hypothetical protein
VFFFLPLFLSLSLSRSLSLSFFLLVFFDQAGVLTLGDRVIELDEFHTKAEVLGTSCCNINSNRDSENPKPKAKSTTKPKRG